VLDNEVPIARVPANRHRADLRDPGVGDGRQAFELQLPGGLSPLARYVIQVRREADGGDIGNSPVTIEAATSFDTALRQTIINAVASLRTDGDEARGAQERVLSLRLRGGSAATAGGVPRCDLPAPRIQRLETSH